MADTATDLFKAINTSAMIDAAKYGGYGGIDMSTLSVPKEGKFGGLLDIVLPMYAAATNAPAAKMLMAGRQAYNLRQYNKAAQQQALYALQQKQLEDANNARIMEQRTGMKLQGPFDTTFASNAAGDLRKDNARGSLNTLLQGGALTLADHADYDPALIRDYLGQQSKATDFANRNIGMDSIQQGQGGSLLSQGLQDFLNQGLKSVSPQPILDMSSPTISTGIGTTGTANQIDTNKSPYLLPTDIPNQASALIQAGLRDAQEASQQKETKRHNIESEKIGQTNAKAHMISANKPSGGGGSPMTLPTQVQNYLQGQISTLSEERKQLWDDSQKMLHKGEDGKLKINTSRAPQYNAMQRRIREIDSQVKSLRGQVTGSTPFGGTSQTKLQNAGKKPAAKGSKNVGAQYGVVY